MTKFTARSLTSCIPICRSDLFDEVTQSGSSQQVDQVWMVPGHVFLSVGNGSKLMTFDCKPVTHQHSMGSSTLDFPSLVPPLQDIFISPVSPNIAYIVQRNGHVQCWQFDSNYQWSALGEFDLCEDAVSEVISICLHPKRCALYWCERTSGQTTEHRVCCMILPDSGQQMSRGAQSSEVILLDCPACDLFPVDYGLLILPRHKAGLTRVTIYWQPSVLQLVSVVTVIGSRAMNHHDVRSPLVFPDVVLSSLPDLSKAMPQSADLGARQDMTTGLTSLLHCDGTVHTFLLVDNDLKRCVEVKSVKLAMPESVLHTPNPVHAWSVHKDVITIATALNTVRLYSATEGHLVHELDMAPGASIGRMVCVRSPTVLFAVLTSSGVTVVQGGKRASKEQSLPSSKQYQTHALQVALLAQQREEKARPEVLDKLATLHRKWTSLQDQQPRSYLSDTADDYLAEFWRLEEEASKLGQQQSWPAGQVCDTREMVREAVNGTRGMSPDGAMAEMLWLSLKHPQHLLTTLLGDLDIEKDKLTAEDQTLWTATLGLDGGNGGHSPLTFELVCRLLYQERPDALVAFVRNAQTVSEQSVGVSAFIRRKHKLQYYVRAMECLPEPGHSKISHKAAYAKAQIILKGATDHGAELALRSLLHHGCWAEAISLLQQLGPSFPQQPSLFSLLLQYLLQAQELSHYAAQVFSLLPSWKSFLPALKVMGENQQSSASTSHSSGLFCSGPPDIPLSAVQSPLLSLLTTTDPPPSSLEGLAAVTTGAAEEASLHSLFTSKPFP